VSATPIYLGIDVACASNKRLPICAAALGSTIEPLEIPAYLLRLIPRGRGNREITEVAPFIEVYGATRVRLSPGWMKFFMGRGLL